MATTLLKIVLGFALIQGICTKSFQNVTVDKSKTVNIEALEAWKKNMTSYISDLLEKESQNQKKRVFFHTRMPSTNVVYNKNSIIKFNDVVSNEGNHFFPGDSIFISPVSGVYLFSWSMQVYNSKTINTELRVNNVVKDRLNANLGGSTGYLCVSRSTICNVNKDDHVWVQTGEHYSENYFNYHNGAASTFIGVLLYEL